MHKTWQREVYNVQFTMKQPHTRNQYSTMWKTLFPALTLIHFALVQAEGRAAYPGSVLQAVVSDSLRPPPLVNCPELPGPGYHIVQPGQTLYAISRAYEIPIQSLISWNNIGDPDQIEVCQKIWLRKPSDASAAPITYSAISDQSPRSITSLPVARRQDVYWGNTAYRATTSQSQTPVTNTQPAYYDEIRALPHSYSSPSTTTLPPPSDCAEKSGLGYHIVQSGETLAGIAKRYGIPEEDLKKINNIKSSGILKKCMRVELLLSGYVRPEGKKNTILEIPPVSPMSGASLHDPNAPDPLKPTPYLIQKAESLVSFAIRTKTNPQVLASLNKIPIDAQLRPGQSLILPSR